MKTIVPTNRKKNNSKPIHFGSISMSLAKGLYENGKYSLLLTLLYIDSRKQKSESDGYVYPFEYNAPDIHYNTGIGLKAINTHLRMLAGRGALELITDGSGSAARTRKGAKRYKVVKKVYESDWGPSSRGESVSNEGHPEPSTNAGQSEDGAQCPAVGAAPERPASESHGALSDLSAGHSGPSANALRPGHSAPTNDNEIVQDEKKIKKQQITPGSASAAPALNAPALAAASPGPKESESRSSEKGSSASREEGHGMSSGSIVSAPVSLPSTACAGSGARDGGSVPSQPTTSSHDDEALDPNYHIPVSYVKRYEYHADELNDHLANHPELGQRIADATDEEAGKLLMQLLDSLDLH